jgi:hypothetical protein
MVPLKHYDQMTWHAPVAGWMPLYVYAFPVTAIAAFLLALGGIGLEGLEVSSTGEMCGPFGWVRKGEH